MNQLYDENNPNFQSNTFNTYRVGAGYRLLAGSLILRGSLQYMSFESKKYDDDVLTATNKSQRNVQFNTQYNLKPLRVGETLIKTRAIGSYEKRQYVSEYTDYTDSMFSARFEMTF